MPLDTAPRDRVPAPDEVVVWAFQLPQPGRPRRSVRRALLRQVLDSYGQSGALCRTCDRCGSEDHGKPRLVVSAGATRPPVTFSVSSTDGAVVVACSGGMELGVDVESSRRSVPPHLSPHLGAASVTDERGLLDVWVSKEAVLKYLGVGLAEPMSALAMDTPPATGHWTRARLRGRGPVAAVRLLDIGHRYTCAVATPERPSSIHVVDRRCGQTRAPAGTTSR